MIRIPLLVSLLALATAASAAEPADNATAKVDATFGNTVLSIYPDGRSQKIWLQPDGTWTGLSRRGNALAGKWSVKGQKVCLRQSKPPTLPISFCQTFPSDPVKGVDAKDLLGTPIHLKLVKGHVENAEG
ncbi:MAG TPA: hypothetical protein VNW53_02330 [Phenylobacterium sp.]|jgi:hypothetical protein|uniref:hypothetical protein n=1 Tax=Phenylobacterium sp. TaxID=1871053 RepID=UPI002CC7AF30|nr:hypothetical protein [Phenylobacterium sp.]HXA37812.1 hypothetical protein [Phenylobacterium sp.]